MTDKRAAHELRKQMKREQQAARESRLRGSVEGRRYVSARHFSAEQHTPIETFESKYPPPPTLDAGTLPVGYEHNENGHIGWTWTVSQQHTWMPKQWFKCKTPDTAKTYRACKKEEQDRLKAASEQQKVHESRITSLVHMFADNLMQCPRALAEFDVSGRSKSESLYFLNSDELEDFWKRVMFFVNLRRRRNANPPRDKISPPEVAAVMCERGCGLTKEQCGEPILYMRSYGSWEPHYCCWSALVGMHHVEGRGWVPDDDDDE